jgi:primase-polymerase (primpol)-like protein
MTAESVNPFFKWIADEPLNAKNFTAEQRTSFLTAIKSDPTRVLAFFREQMIGRWTVVGAFKLKTMVVYNAGDEQHLLDYIKKHFAKELADVQS